MALVIFFIVAIEKPSGPADEAGQDKIVHLIDVSSQFKTKEGKVLCPVVCKTSILHKHAIKIRSELFRKHSSGVGFRQRAVL